MNTKAYKVVFNRKGVLLSLTYQFLNSATQIEYKTDGTLIIPSVKDSLIFIVPSLEDAQSWVLFGELTELWEVECDVIELIPTTVLAPSADEVIAFWYSDEKKKKNIVLDTRTFYGCKSLRMIKKIK